MSGIQAECLVEPISPHPSRSSIQRYNHTVYYVVGCFSEMKNALLQIRVVHCYDLCDARLKLAVSRELPQNRRKKVASQRPRVDGDEMLRVHQNPVKIPDPPRSTFILTVSLEGSSCTCTTLKLAALQSSEEPYPTVSSDLVITTKYP